MERFLLLAAPNLNISCNIYFKKMSFLISPSIPLGLTYNFFKTLASIVTQPGKHTFEMWFEGDSSSKCTGAQGPDCSSCSVLSCEMTPYKDMRSLFSSWTMSVNTDDCVNTEEAVCFFMTVPPLLPSQSSVHTLLVPVCKVQWRNCLSEGQGTLAVPLGLPQACACMFMSTTHTCTLHIYMWGEKEKKKKKIFPLRKTEMNLENKRQNEISQIDKYLYVKSKQSNRSRRHSRHSQGLGKG